MDLSGRCVDYRFRDKIPSVRKVFMDKMSKMKTCDLFYQEDIDKTMTNDYWVEKFLEYNRGSVSKTVDGIIYSMKIQKQYRLRELKDQDFAAEAFMVGSLFRYEADRLGRMTLYSQMKYSPACKETRELSKQFALYRHLKMEEESGDKGFICVNDFAGLTMANVDLKLIKAALEMRLVFPNSVQLFICVNVHFAIRGFFNSVKYAMPVEERKGFLMMSPLQLQEVIPIENIPDFLGGTCQIKYKGPEVVPQGCQGIKENLITLFKHHRDNNNNQTRKDCPVMIPDILDQETLVRVCQYYAQLFGVTLH